MEFVVVVIVLAFYFTSILLVYWIFKLSKIIASRLRRKKYENHSHGNMFYNNEQ